MLITPPDVISQTLLAVPMWLLFEAGLIGARFVGAPRASDSSVDIEETSEPSREESNDSPTPEEVNKPYPPEDSNPTDGPQKPDPN